MCLYNGIADCARELFKPSKYLASSQVCNKSSWFWVSGFCE